ncbi:secretory lipase-domain-containing protein [Aspergillus avenaceus]|uniref:Secretory lipase-domain-containing protein n=1 Tax=Aspergillus avenaceus TaxID=36643 RepID=A0A5N6U6V1_ASPAV|nr:secretory lipase-domain-containing protein [Aspergillus avenaceus]
MYFHNPLYTLCILLCAIGHTLARSIPSWYLKRDGPLLPSQDPFYTPSNTSWNVAEPGTILDSRNVTIGTAEGTPLPLEAAYQLLYRTTDALGHPTYAVTTVMIPVHASLDRLVSYQTAYDSPLIDCSPSYGLQHGASSHANEPMMELSLMAKNILSEGIPISMPDYEGVQAAYVVGTQAGYAVLDSLRAVSQSTNITGIPANATITLYGYSGGGLAAEWASELHASYAPDVQIAAAALGGLSVNLTEGFFTGDTSSWAGLIAGGLVGLGNAYPALAEYIDQHLKPEYKEKFYLPRQECFSGATDPTYGYVPKLAGQNISTFFDNGFGFISEFKELIENNAIMGRHGIPGFPVFVFRGTDDDVAGQMGETHDLVREFCSAGASIQFAEIAGETHLSALAKGYPAARQFLLDAFEGRVPSRCTNSTI